MADSSALTTVRTMQVGDTLVKEYTGTAGTEDAAVAHGGPNTPFHWSIMLNEDSSDVVHITTVNATTVTYGCTAASASVRLFLHFRDYAPQDGTTTDEF